MSISVKSKFDESPGNEEKETKMSMEGDQPSYSEDDDELTESKIKAFLDEKVIHAHYTTLIIFLNAFVCKSLSVNH